MDQIMVVYWSSTGNTEAMAKCIGEGIQAAGKRSKSGRYGQHFCR